MVIRAGVWDVYSVRMLGATINKKREVWEARKRGGLVVSGAGRGICIGGSRTPRL